MNLMLVILIIYLCLLVAISFFDVKKVGDFKQFAVAGKNQNTYAVFLSLMATIVGASATIGVADNATKIGFAAFWWLAVGSVGLVLQGLLISQKIHDIDATTLPDLATVTLGKVFGKLIALIIAVSWIGIIAAQFVSIAKLFTIVTSANYKAIVIVVAIAAIGYTIIGGQLSVVKTDRFQSWVVFISIICVFAWLFGAEYSNKQYAHLTLSEIHLLNENFSYKDLLTLLFITGGAYFLGPDVISRNIISKDGKVARRAAFLSATTLLIFSIIITLIAMWVAKNVDLAGTNPMLYLINNIIPLPLRIALCIGILSTLLSTIDTCLVNAASIIEHDILGSNNVLRTRIFVTILGICGLVISLFKTDIIGLLLKAYSVYVPGIVCPLFIGIMCYGKRQLNKPLIAIAVVVPAILGFWWPLPAMATSLVISILAMFVKKKIYKS